MTFPKATGGCRQYDREVGLPYKDVLKIQHPAEIRGSRGTWWGTISPFEALERKVRERQRSNVFVALVSPDGARVRACRALHTLLAMGEGGLQHDFGISRRLQGWEHCAPPEDFLEWLPSREPPRICVLGESWQACELVAFCDLAGAQTTWLLEPTELRQGQGFRGGMLPRLLQQVKRGGRVQVRTSYSVKRVVAEDVGAAGGAGDSPGSPYVKRRQEFYVEAVQSKVGRGGPFDVVVACRSVPALRGVDSLPGVVTSEDGRVHVDGTGNACPFVWALGAIARRCHRPGAGGMGPAAGLGTCGVDVEALVARAQAFSRQHLARWKTRSREPLGKLSGLRQSPALPPVPGISLLLSNPPLVLLGRSAEEAGLGGQCEVFITTTRHDLVPALSGGFTVGVICSQPRPLAGAEERGSDSEEGQDMAVAGVEIMADSGGLPLLLGLLVGFSAALESKATKGAVDAMLRAWPLASSPPPL